MGLLLREIPQSPQLPSLLPARSLLRVCLCVKVNKLLCPSSAPHTPHVTMNECGAPVSCSSLWPRIIIPHVETRVGWLSSAYTGMLCRRVGTLEGEKGQKCVCVCVLVTLKHSVQKGMFADIPSRNNLQHHPPVQPSAQPAWPAATVHKVAFIPPLHPNIRAHQRSSRKKSFKN